jgi:tape measure domain-containing protein
MSKEIDQRVVQMEFDNKRFESNVATTMSTLDKLKQKLNFAGATKGLDNIDNASKKVNMTALGSAVESVQAKFSALQVMGVTALANITNSAINAGKRIAAALTIDPIKAGFQEYETQIGAVQTILANTESKGSTLQDVNRALDELNTYADKTIYNFTEMTRNIGTFTAAGVDLDKSVTSIKGIANLAAVSGSTSQQASTAMYQLSQALASGTVKLMDWNSVVNAGMGGQVFQDALKRTAKNMGTNVDALIKKYGSFRESLSQGNWLTADVLTETLTQLSGAYNEADLLAKGYTKEQAKDILDLADTAVQAATKVKTFTQLWDTLKESAQSGWTQTWEIIIGDFGEAKEFLTGISDTLGGMLNASAEARNTLLSGGLSSGWKQLLNAGVADEAGFQDTIKEIAKEHGVSFDKMAKKNETFEQTLTRALKKGKIDSDMLGESVSKMAKKMEEMSPKELKAAGYTEEHVNQIKELNKGLKDGSISMDEFVEKMMRPSGRQNIIDSLWNTFNALLEVIKPIKEAFSEIFPAVTSEQLYKLTENLKKFTEGLGLSGDAADKLKRTAKGVFAVFDIFRKIITSVVEALFDLSQSDGITGLADLLLSITAAIGDFFTGLNEGFKSDGISGVLSGFASGISDFLSKTVGGLQGFTGIISSIGDFIVKVFTKMWDGLQIVFGWIKENISIGDIFAGLAGGGIFLAAKKFGSAFEKIGEFISKPFKSLFGEKEGSVSGIKDIIGSIKDVFESLNESLQAFTTGIKVASLVAIAIAIGILSASLKTISSLKVPDIAKSLLAIAALMGILTVGFKSVTKSLNLFSGKGVVKAGISMMLMAKAIDILADAMVKLSDLSLAEIAKGLLAVGGGVLELTLGLKLLDKVKVSPATSLAMIALAKSCEILADALKEFAKMTWEEITRGLYAMGGALIEFVAAIAVLSKAGGFKSLLGSTSLLIAVQSLDELAEALKKFGKMKWDNIKQGLAAMGGALTELAIVIIATGKIAGFSGLFGSGSIYIMTQGLGDLADALKKFGKMKWPEIGRGLSAMGGALAELGIVSGLLGGLAGFSGIFGSGAILIAVQGLDELANALKKFGGMTWDEIKQGLTGMGGALAELGIVTGLLGGLAGFSGIFGSGALLIGIQGLDQLADALKKFGEMSWDEIKRGLVGMGGSLTELAVISGLLGTLAPLGGLLGSGSLLLGIQGLGDLADALKKFGEMSWDEIGRGLSAMGGALGEVALGGFLSTLSGIGAKAISELAEPLGVLADSVKKWAKVKVPENLGWQLTQLANGVFSFTLNGSGASALATAAPAIGIMADSVKKWADVTIPDGLSAKISSLSGALSGFTFKGMGASALATAAPAVGIMADSIKKWSDVTIPENLNANLSGLADAISSFSFAFMGGWSMSAVDGPLGKLADSVKKWADVTIPSTLKDDLTGLSDAVKSFSFAFMGGWSISSLSGPLGKLADSVKKWKDVSVPDKLPSQLKSLATAVNKLSGIGNISYAVSNVASISGSVEKLSKVDFKAINSGISGLSKAIKNIATTSDSLAGIGENLSNYLITPIKNAATKLSKAGGDMVSAMAKGVKSKQYNLFEAAAEMASSMTKAINNKKASYEKAGMSLVTKFISGLNDKKSSSENAMKKVAKDSATATYIYYENFYSAGSYLVTGFANGISENSFRAAAKAKAMANAAEQAAKDALDINSPSKVFRKIGMSIPEGFAQGIDRLKGAVTASSVSMTDTAIYAVQDSISRIADAINTDMDSQPTIRPVLDLSDVTAGARSINSMFAMSPSVGVLANADAISYSMSQRQNGANNDDVVAAINNLKDALGEVSGDSYVVGDVTYDDGSNVNGAVESLIRAIRMERRT